MNHYDISNRKTHRAVDVLIVLYSGGRGRRHDDMAGSADAVLRSHRQVGRVVHHPDMRRRARDVGIGRRSWYPRV